MDLAGESERLWLRVTDIKQYLYCPRIIYYTYCMPVPRALTYKMEEGKSQHVRVMELEERRSLRAYGLETGERVFRVSLSSERLGLCGVLDMVILRPTESIPVEFKHSMGKVGLNLRYQLVAYGLLVEERWGKPVRRGFIYRIPEKRAVEVVIRPNMRRYVVRVLREMRQMVKGEVMPGPTRRRERCVDCEYRRYCKDI